MNKMKLIPLSTTDLSFRYARRMEGNKIAHYCVPFSDVMLGNDPTESVANFIRETEPDAEIEFAQLPSNTAPHTSPAGDFLNKEPAIKVALEQFQCNSFLYQYSIPVTSWGKWIALKVTLPRLWNSAVAPINNLLVKLQAHKIKPLNVDELELPLSEKTSAQPKASASKLIVIPTFRDFSADYNFERVMPCLYHSVAYEEGDELIAEEAILNDLRIYQSYGAIMGHLAMPTKMRLADTTGSGKGQYALLCFFFADFTKIPNYNPLLAPKAPSPFPGVRTAGSEGALVTLPELDISSRYNIELIDVSAVSHSQNLDICNDSYNNLRVQVEKINLLRKKRGY